MGKIVSILLFLFAAWGGSCAQKKIELKGVVRDSSGSAVIGASIHYYNETDSGSTLSDKQGDFYVKIPWSDSIEVLITMEGYEPFKKSYLLREGLNLFALPPVVLHSQYGQLASVTVVHIKPFTIRQDTIEYHARAFIIHPGSELERLLKKLPGLEVDMDGTVRMQGKKISKIRINGSDFPGDMLTAIRNLPADIVDIVQVIDDYGDKARLTGVKSRESEKVLNVILKQNKREGVFSQLQTGVGNKNKYEATLFSDAIKNERHITFNAWLRNLSPVGNIYEKGIYIGYANKWNKKWMISSSAGLSSNVRSIGNSMIQDNFVMGNTTHQQQNNLETESNRDIGIGYVLEYIPSQNTTIRISPSLNNFRSFETSSNRFSSIQQDSGSTKITQGYSLIHSNIKNLSAGSDIYWEKRFSNSGNRLSVQSSYHYLYQRQEADNITNTDIQFNNQTYFSKQHYMQQITNINRDMSVVVNYYISFGKYSFLELGYGWHSQSTRNSLFTHAPDSLQYDSSVIDLLSNDYRSSLISQQAHGGYIRHSNNFNLTLSMDAQSLIQQGEIVGKNFNQDYHYFNLLTLTQLAYSISPEQKLGLEYNGNVAPPEILKLQPVININNPQYPITGNPDLKPSYNHNLKLYYEQFSPKQKLLQSFRVELRYNVTCNAIVPNVIYSYDSSSVIQHTTYSNANGYHFLDLSYHLGFPTLYKRLQIAISGNLNKTHIPTIVNNKIYGTSSFSWSQNIDFNLNVPNIDELSLSGKYSKVFSWYSPDVSPNTFSSVAWSLNNRFYIFKKWILNSFLYQLFTANNDHFQSNPVLLNASLQRQFLKNNQVTLGISANDIFNGDTGTAQIVTPTSIAYIHNYALGRYFMLNLILKLQNFRQ